MKTENTPENKAKFFAQYYSQNIYISDNKHDDLIETVNPYTITKANAGTENGLIVLTPLKNISDEDAIDVAKIMYPKDKYHSVSDLILWGNGIAREIENESKDIDVIWFYGVIASIDFLRSKSYLLPYKDLSTEDLIAYGWAKES